MELYLDTANVAEVERLARIFPIAGVTTNPSIIAASKESIWEVLPRLQKAIGDEGILFAQTMSRDAQGMVEEAKRLRDARSGLRRSAGSRPVRSAFPARVGITYSKLPACPGV